MRRGVELAADAPTVVQDLSYPRLRHMHRVPDVGHFWLGCALELDERLPEYFFNTAFIINPDSEIFREP